MCFWKSNQSKVLVAKRDIVVWKVGIRADQDIFIPYYINFTYKTNTIYQNNVCFNKNVIAIGFHSYINVIFIKSLRFHDLNVIVYKKTNSMPKIGLYPTYMNTLYIGKFIIPKGATYCINELNEVISDGIIYTGKYTLI
jgi:hypothetical protein